MNVNVPERSLRTGELKRALTKFVSVHVYVHERVHVFK
jgi:hypothetical protein